MKAYICNKCGFVLTDELLMKEMTRIEFKNDNIGLYQTWHLCKECKDKIYKWRDNKDEKDGAE